MKKVVITGVSTGIGYSSAKILCNSGYFVYGSIRTKEDAEKLKKITAIFSNKIEKIINFGPIDSNRDNISDNLCTINNNPEELLPFNMGLRSLIVEKFTDILSSSKKPIITGFMPPHIGIRIDDVMGEKIDKYLPILLKHNWKPNLGIFTDSFKDYKNNITKYISSQDNLNNIEISPHAYNARNFIFHDYRSSNNSHHYVAN